VGTHKDLNGVRGPGWTGRPTQSTEGRRRRDCQNSLMRAMRNIWALKYVVDHDLKDVEAFIGLGWIGGCGVGTRSFPRDLFGLEAHRLQVLRLIGLELNAIDK
jgi:hypothetical protein